MRPGRLDRILYVGPPDREGREDIMKIRTKQMKVEEGLDIAQIATLVSENTSYNDDPRADTRRRKAVQGQKYLHCVKRLLY